MTTAHVNSISPIAYIKAIFAQEPSITLGLLVSVGIEVEQAVVAAHPLTWQAAVPVVLSVLIRFFVTPTASVPASGATVGSPPPAPPAAPPAAA